uniref:Uncharacterized protein isoform X1 n=1 Tax=Nicotiana tabacum TaxID=4097 RepID=A0A1S3YWK9_TOBAC|nr:PREDICTED: uncharacterized protein LOC107780488 isoform X1 [Nicotiana tabacum]
MLHTKKIMAALSDEEIAGIKNLINSAILDSEVKGGLRWPIGKDSSGGRYAVIGVWHTTAKSYGNPSIRFKLRHADRFDFGSSTGEVSRETSLKMPGIVSQLRVGFLSMTSNYVYLIFIWSLWAILIHLIWSLWVIHPCVRAIGVTYTKPYHNILRN